MKYGTGYPPDRIVMARNLIILRTATGLFVLILVVCKPIEAVKYYINA